MNKAIIPIFLSIYKLLISRPKSILICRFSFPRRQSFISHVFPVHYHNTHRSAQSLKALPPSRTGVKCLRTLSSENWRFLFGAPQSPPLQSTWEPRKSRAKAPWGRFPEDVTAIRIPVQNGRKSTMVSVFASLTR